MPLNLTESRESQGQRSRSHVHGPHLAGVRHSYSCLHFVFVGQNSPENVLPSEVTGTDKQISPLFGLFLPLR